MEDLRKHIKEEETDDIPALEKVLKSADSESIAKSFQRARKFVPSHRHPMARQRLVPWDLLYLVLMLIRKRPPFETVLDLLTTPVDRLADILRKFPDEDDKARS
jgi:hypothetical protein